MNLRFPTPTMQLVVLLLLLFSSALSADAWWAKGHMSVAEIAKRNLKPDVLEKVELAVSSLKELGQFPRSPDMVEVAPWADDLKEMGLYTMSSWHYSGIPYIPDDFKLDVSPIDPVNVETIIADLHKAIKDPKTTSDIVVTSIANLIHYVGDVHQPCHSTDMYSQQYPDGDEGGNRVIVFMGEEAETEPIKLHFFWDSMTEGQSQVDHPRPLGIANRKIITDFADYLEATYKFTDEQKNEMNSTVMIEECHDLAANVAYKGIVNGTTLTQDYKKNAKSVAESQVALAGYRLAAILNDALSDVSEQMVGAALQNTEASFQSQPYEPPTKKKGISGGATAGIAVALFVVGVAVSVILSCLLFRACMPQK